MTTDRVILVLNGHARPYGHISAAVAAADANKCVFLVWNGRILHKKANGTWQYVTTEEMATHDRET